MGAPEGGEDLHRLADRRFHLPGLAQEIGAEALGGDSTGRQIALDGLVGGDSASVVPAVPDDRAGTGLGDHGSQDLGRLAAAQDEPLPQPLQIGPQRPETLGEPPGGGGPHGALAGSGLLADIKADDRPAVRRGLREGGIVGEAEVVAEPDDDRRLRHGEVTGRAKGRFTAVRKLFGVGRALCSKATKAKPPKRGLRFGGSQIGSPGRIRTSDQPVNSRLLYH